MSYYWWSLPNNWAECLNSISVLLKNPALVNKSQIKIELLDKDKKLLKSLQTSGISVGDPSWITFKFPNIETKKGDTLFIKVHTDNPKPDTLYI